MSTLKQQLQHLTGGRLDTEELEDLVGFVEQRQREDIVNRFEVINHLPDGTGREVVVWKGEPFRVEYSLQDGGRTLKVFLTDLFQPHKDSCTCPKPLPPKKPGISQHTSACPVFKAENEGKLSNG